MQLLPTKNKVEPQDSMPDFSLAERRGLKTVYWGLCWTYLSIWLLVLISIFQAAVKTGLLPQLDVEQCNHWSGLFLAARLGLWLSGALLLLSAPAGLKIRKYAFFCLLLDAGWVGVTGATWFGYQVDLDVLGLRLVSFALHLVFLKNLARALNNTQLTVRCGNILNKLVYAGVFIGLAYVGVEYHPYFRYASFGAGYFLVGAILQYFTTLAKLRTPIRNAYGFA